MNLKNSLKESALNKVQYIIERLVNMYNSYYTKIETEISRKQNDYYLGINEQEKLLKNPFRKKSFSISPDGLKVLYKNFKYKEAYKSTLIRQPVYKETVKKKFFKHERV